VNEWQFQVASGGGECGDTLYRYHNETGRVEVREYRTVKVEGSAFCEAMWLPWLPLDGGDEPTKEAP